MIRMELEARGSAIFSRTNCSWREGSVNGTELTRFHSTCIKTLGKLSVFRKFRDGVENCGFLGSRAEGGGGNVRGQGSGPHRENILVIQHEKHARCDLN